MRFDVPNYGLQILSQDTKHLLEMPPPANLLSPSGLPGCTLKQGVKVFWGGLWVGEEKKTKKGN